jgi:hypothetical protein
MREATDRPGRPAQALLGEVPAPVEPTAPTDPEGPVVPNPALPEGPVAPAEPPHPVDPAPERERPQPDLPDEVPQPDGRMGNPVLQEGRAVTISAGRLRACGDRGLWERRPGVGGVGTLDGYSVHAIDAPLGEVVASSDEPGRGYVIAAGGPSLQQLTLTAGRTVMLPVGLIERVNPTARAILVGCTLAQIAHAPAFESDRYQDAAYRTELDRYYGSPAAFGNPSRG